MKKTTLLICILFLLTLCGCKNDTKTNKITVSVSIPPQVEFVKAVCGDEAEINVMIPAGASAEKYEPAPKDIAALNDSDIYFSIGVPAEKNSILPHIPNTVRLIDLTIAVREKYADRKIGSERDPHVWLSPKRAAVIVEEIATQMSVLDPENASTYSSNAASYINKLSGAEAEITKIFKNKKLKVFYISHPSYGYFAEDFGLKMVGLEKNGHEATAKDLTEIINSAKADGTRVIFCQEETSKSLAEVVAKEIGGEVQMLKPLSPDYLNNLLYTANIIGKAVN